MWRNSVGPRGPVTGEFPTREAALEAGRDEARVRGVQHVVRDLDGTAIERHRYPRRSGELPG
ncbi:DUF2188 domain-containing protein [Nocardioides sp. SR21]|uniref:DUF2188 domain-containing protein n=1 Tax=Nocardioides sp. SR21 TaxID=2919501 RepID=UPI001FAA71A2|nr:DUF2188 domain-containing protein [Nocardioides sp. SR21]